MLKKILIANRGEIACRVIKTCREEGYPAVAIYSDADKDARHVAMADEAVHIGASQASESYLNIAKVIDACKKSGANAVHPGYGFLSENAEFARALATEGIQFIGPSPEAIELMGSKRQSKIAMIKAGVLCIPGYDGEDQSDDALYNASIKVGLPVMVKASAGGGGRGMRLVEDEKELLASIQSARSEAISGFGSGELIIEKAVLKPRHIEIQVFADKQGNTLYLGERDCSVQRRHQKVVEEAPSPFVDAALRKKMGEAAVLAAKSCNYVGAGTVEFLTDDDGNFYFLEMNTRLQVEHPVTELTTGLDLVALQLSVANGDSLPLTQEEVQQTGHAIEVRLYAEDPAQGFLPQTGRLLRWHFDGFSGVRVDSGVDENTTVSAFYDPMLAKVIAYGENREQARRRLVYALERSTILGIKDNRSFLTQILSHQAFIDGKATTAFIEEHMQSDAANEPDSLTLALAGALFLRPGAFSTQPLGLRTLNLRVDNQTHRLQCEGDYESTTKITVDDSNPNIFNEIEILSDKLLYMEDNVRKSVSYHRSQDSIWIGSETGNWKITQFSSEHDGGKGGSSTEIRALMDGLLVALNTKVGDKVSAGETLAVLEAMKMEHALKAEISGEIAAVHCQQSDQLKSGQLLIEITPDEESS